MQLTYAQLEGALAHIHAIHPDRLPTFRARIKQLQRLGFPQGVNIGRGAKMPYAAEHLFKMATAFALIQSGLPAERACRLVTDNWKTIARGIGIAAIQRVERESNSTPSIYAMLFLRTLDEIQNDLGRREQPLYTAKVVSGSYIGSEVRDQGWHAYAFHALRLSDLLKESQSALSIVGIEPPWSDPEVHSWADGADPANVLVEGRPA